MQAGDVGSCVCLPGLCDRCELVEILGLTVRINGCIQGSLLFVHLNADASDSLCGETVSYECCMTIDSRVHNYLQLLFRTAFHSPRLVPLTYTAVILRRHNVFASTDHARECCGPTSYRRARFLLSLVDFPIPLNFPIPLILLDVSVLK